MSQALINQCLADLDRLKKVSGSRRESVVREAFKDLLKGWSRQHDLVFVPEYELDTKTRDRRYVDGALLHELRVPFGYWEAKDDSDDLDAEIATKPEVECGEARTASIEETTPPQPAGGSRSAFRLNGGMAVHGFAGLALP